MSSLPDAAAVPTLSPAADQFPKPAPSRTPARLRRLQVVAALAVLASMAFGLWTTAELGRDLAEAPSVVEQYARIGQVQHGLVQAGNLAALAVINKESSTGEHATAASDRLADVARLLVAAAGARPEDRERLQEINAAVISYGHSLSAATALSDQQATKRLGTADDQLEELRTQLAEFQAQLVGEATTTPWVESPVAMVLVGLVALGVLVWISWVAAQSSHRVLNLGLVAAIVAVVAITGFTVSAQGSAGDAAGRSRGSELARVVNLETGATQLAAAHHVQVRAALNRSWTTAQRAAYTEALDAARAALADDPDPAAFTALAKAHERLAGLLAQGEWAAADKALLDDGDGSLPGLSARFSETTATASAAAVAAAREATTTADQELSWPLFLIGSAGLLGAFFAIRGLSLRIKEYQ